MRRRDFLLNSGALGCSLAASPLLTPVTFAAAPWEQRLVVIILRGGMDGLDVVRPLGDPGWAGLGRTMAGDGGAAELDGFFALHPAVADLMPLWDAGQLGFVHAVSTPYRDKRSHFDGQDLLEAGTAALDGPGAREGWLNRMLQTVPGLTGQTAYAIGRGDMRLMSGAAPVAEWSPDADLDLTPQSRALLELMYARDPAFAAAATEAIELTQNLGLAGDMASDQAGAEMMAAMAEATKGGGHRRIAKFAAERLREEARVAAFSVNGWDTHRGQKNAIRPAATRLMQVLGDLRDGLGPVWDRTAVLAMTEFGRTARQNGTGGTDHGTGGAMLFAGGALNGGRVHGDWPGLGEGQLYDGRDLLPTADVRAQAAWVMRGLFGLERGVLERSVFPGLDMGDDPGLVL